jgi:FkbM family methyltransferase
MHKDFTSQKMVDMSIRKVKSKIFEMQNSIFRVLLKTEFLQHDKKEFVFLGNSYSSYWFPTDMLDKKGTIWGGVGLGRDSSFEKDLLQRGYKFFGFEPEMDCYMTSRRQFDEPLATIENYGLWDKSGEFHYTGENISILNVFGLEEQSREKLVIRSLWDVAEEKDFDSNQAPRILKLSIEGAEREILMKLLREPLDFEVIIFQAEFLFHLGFKKVIRKINAYQELRTILNGMQFFGWEIANLSLHQITLISSDTNA